LSDGKQFCFCLLSTEDSVKLCLFVSGELVKIDTLRPCPYNVAVVAAVTYFWLRLHLEGGLTMSSNVADEIRLAEEEARQIVADAKSEAAKIIAESRAASEKALQEAKQKAHRRTIEEVQRLEAEAEAKAEEMLSEGRKEAASFVDSHQARVKTVSAWIGDEVMKRYGDSPV
jgi:vacuolar-type H+-ATPase subunit H